MAEMAAISHHSHMYICHICTVPLIWSKTAAWRLVCIVTQHQGCDDVTEARLGGTDGCVYIYIYV